MTNTAPKKPFNEWNVAYGGSCVRHHSRMARTRIRSLRRQNRQAPEPRLLSAAEMDGAPDPYRIAFETLLGAASPDALRATVLALVEPPASKSETGIPRALSAQPAANGAARRNHQRSGRPRGRPKKKANGAGSSRPKHDQGSAVEPNSSSPTTLAEAAHEPPPAGLT
jgi:hypothetical protein